MKIKWGALVVDGRGKLGGHVASQNKGGSYIRTKVTPSNPQTVYQSMVRQLFGAISAGWSALGGQAILAWNSAVEDWKKTNIFGDLKNPSGKALYQRLNQSAQLVGYPAITLPPVKEDMPSGVLEVATIALGAETLTLTGNSSAAGSTTMIFGTPPVSQGTTFVKNRLRHFSTVLSNAQVPGTAFSDYEDRFGTPALGQKIFIGVKYVLPTGQQSPLQVVQATVVA